jgi:hypothetical protein
LKGHVHVYTAIISLMRYRRVIILFLIFSLFGCQFLTQPFTLELTATQSNTSLTTEISVPSRTALLSTKANPTTPAPNTTATKEMAPFDVLFHPDGNLYVGDQVSMEIIAPSGVNIDTLDVIVHVDRPIRMTLGPAKFGYFGIGRRPEATMYWNWNTSELQAGIHELTFSVRPLGVNWTQSVTLLPAADIPPPETEAHWTSTESECCNIFYITQTSSERDMPELLPMIDKQAEDVSQKMDYTLNQPVSIVLVPRILGQGGFANQEVSVSYLDRNYTAAPADIILHHELVHLVDARLGGEWRPSIFVEGLAVYLSGGHFKPEPLIPRAAALLDLEWYLPLNSLVDDFYTSQHEIGYLEAGALVEFMVKTWGWQAFNSFYRGMQPPAQGEKPIDVLNKAMLEHFQLPMAGVEARFLDDLRNEPNNPEFQDDVRETVNFFDAVRRYQQVYDPSAYFLTAWMLDAKQMRERRIVADYLRHPSLSENLALETMLNAAGEHLQMADYPSVRQLVNAVNAVLGARASTVQQPYSVNPLAEDYYEIVQVLEEMGFQAQKIEVNGNMAQAWVSQDGPELIKIELNRLENGWMALKTGFIPPSTGSGLWDW